MFDYTNEGKYVVKLAHQQEFDFSDVENSWSILPTGQSGNSAHYNDQSKCIMKASLEK
jgi:penicillin amidase